MGVKRFATLSNGEYFEPLNSFKRHQKPLAKAQRLMSRKKKFSKNWQKVKSKVQAIHSTIANARRDYL
jgi:putative transposase